MNPLENLCKFVPVPTLVCEFSLETVASQFDQLGNILIPDANVDTCKVTVWWGNKELTDNTATCRFGKESLCEVPFWLHSKLFSKVFYSVVCLLVETNNGEQFGFVFTH